MVENLVDLFNELSHEIIRNELDINDDEFESKWKSGYYSKYVRKLRRKGFDILLRNHSEMDYTDPCKTPYGADWNPLLLILDYGGELAKYGAEKASKKLNTNIQTLQSKSYKCLGDMYKLIFMLRGSYVVQDDEFQPNFLNTVSNYSLESNGSFSAVHDDDTSCANRDIFLSPRSLHTNQSTNLLESGCQLLKNLSNRSLSERISNRHLACVSNTKIVNQTRSSASSEIPIKKKSYSSSSFVQVASNLCASNHLLWDSFVEKPLSYKLRHAAVPALENQNNLANGSGEHVNVHLNETQNLSNMDMNDKYWTKISDVEDTLLNKKNELNCEDTNSSHDMPLYPILKENILELQNYESCFSSKFKLRSRIHRQGVRNSFFQSSATLILALWEQELKFNWSYDSDKLVEIPELRVMELDQFLKDVQFLLVGVGTDTFKLDEDKMCFIMKEGTCLEGVTPPTLLSFSKEYLDIGSCYVKLSHYTSLNLKQQMISGLKDSRIIFKVFWKSIYEYLCQHSQYVLKIPISLGLLEFKACVRNLRTIITAVAEVCKVFEPSISLPEGGQLLSYLFQATQKVTNKYTAGVFFRLLKDCCEIYLLRLLQDWMFQGHLDRHYREFFVEHRPKKPRCKDRSYYLSFYMFSDRIPSFLKGLEKNIFNCGKTVHLLKLIQPESKLCRLLEMRAYPKMKLCLSERELLEQEKAFADYAKHITNICGHFATITSLREEEYNRELHYEKYIAKIKKEQEVERALMREESLEELRRKREEQNKWLKKQMELAAEEKRRKKEEEEKEGKLFVERVRQIAEKEKRIVEEEKRNMKLYYEELMDQLEKRKTESESWRHHSENMNKKNAMLHNNRSYQEVSLEAEDNAKKSNSLGNNIITVETEIVVDNEGNIVHSETLFSKPELDVVNSNVPSVDVETRIEDIKNENVMDETSDMSDLQLQQVINSRKEYESQVESEAQIIPKDDKKQTTSPSPRKETSTNGSRESTPKSKRKGMASATGPQARAVEHSPKKAVDSKAEAQKNKKKIMGSEFGLGTKAEAVETPVTAPPAEETEAQKIKNKILASEYGLGLSKGESKEGEPEPKPPVPETEAQKIKQKILASEFGIGQKTEKPVVESEGPVVETEAQKNRKKVMSSEYGMGTKTEDVEKDRKKDGGVVTEAEKNKRKFMTSELGVRLESDGTETVKVQQKTSAVETEAKRNKRRVMSSEFGTPAEDSLGRKRVVSAEALRNKQKVMESEFGYPKQPDAKTEESKDLEASEMEQDFYSIADKKDEGKLELDVELGTVRKSSSFAEKALQIFNKKRLPFDEPNFFTLKEGPSSENLQDGPCNYSDVQILFEQHLRRPMVTGDLSEIGAGYADMDVTKFMNYVRRSVLIPLQVQEGIANEALFNHLLKEEKMLSHFNALRNYFFLNDGEFSRRLTQNIFATLAKCTEPQQFFKRSTLNQIVYEALNYTIHSNDPNVQNVSFEIVEMPKVLSHSSHDVLSPFDLSYQVKWPLNIIFTDKALAKYKLVFHFLLKLKRINWTFNENFSSLTYFSRDKHISSRLLINSPHYHRIHIYRHAMAQFMRTLENYISSCSLQFSWLNFQKDLESAKNLDHLYEKHVRYIKEVLKRCFLTKESHELQDYINVFIELSLKFHYSMITGKWVLSSGRYQHTKFDVLKKAFTEFCHLTTEFLRTLRKKINSCHDLKYHELLMEKYEIILR